MLAASVILTACGTDDAVGPEEPVDPQELINVGVTMTSPGLVSGIDPEHVAGLEVDLVEALTQRMKTTPDLAQIRWVPTAPSTAADEVAQGNLDLVVGQLPGEELSDEIAWLGPYAEAEAGLLVHGQPDPEATAVPDAIAPSVIETAADLEDATVCVVAGSSADHPALPVGELTTQRSVTECETGLQSGRYDAIAADSVQLSGVLISDPVAAKRYEMLLWSDIAEELETTAGTADDETAQAEGSPETDDDAEPARPAVPAEVVAPRQYWIGVSSRYCADAAAALESVVTDGVLTDLLAPWEATLGTSPAAVTEDDLVSPTCG